MGYASNRFQASLIGADHPKITIKVIKTYQTSDPKEDSITFGLSSAERGIPHKSYIQAPAAETSTSTFLIELGQVMPDVAKIYHELHWPAQRPKVIGEDRRQFESIGEVLKVTDSSLVKMSSTLQQFVLLYQHFRDDSQYGALR